MAQFLYGVVIKEKLVTEGAAGEKEPVGDVQFFHPFLIGFPALPLRWVERLPSDDKGENTRLRSTRGTQIHGLKQPRVRRDLSARKLGPRFHLAAGKLNIPEVTIIAVVALEEQFSKLRVLPIFAVPEKVIAGRKKECLTKRHFLFLEGDVGDEVAAPEHLVQEAANQMHVFIADLDENTATVSEQIAGDRKPVPEVGQVRVDA